MKTNEDLISSRDVLQMKRDIALIKDHLLGETELTDWAKKELEEARKAPREEYVSHEEVKKMILSK